MIINYPPLSEEEFLKKYLEITNTLLPIEQRISAGEIDYVVATALLPEEKYKYQRFTIHAKRKVAQQLNPIPTVTNLNNRIHSLTHKNFLRKDEDKVLYLPSHLLKALQEYREGKTTDITFRFTNDSFKDN